MSPTFAGVPHVSHRRFPPRGDDDMPEVEIWRCVEAPALLGDEELGVADFVKIFQLEVEEMMVSRPAVGTAEHLDGGRSSGDILNGGRSGDDMGGGKA